MDLWHPGCAYNKVNGLTGWTGTLLYPGNLKISEKPRCSLPARAAHRFSPFQRSRALLCMAADLLDVFFPPQGLGARSPNQPVQNEPPVSSQEAEAAGE